MSLVSLSLKMGEEGGGEGGVVVVGPPTSSTVIQRRWEGLTPGVAALESWSGLTGWELCSGLYTPRITGCQEMSSCLLLVAKILAGGQDRSSCLIFGD